MGDWLAIHHTNSRTARIYSTTSRYWRLMLPSNARATAIISRIITLSVMPCMWQRSVMAFWVMALVSVRAALSANLIAASNRSIARLAAAVKRLASVEQSPFTPIHRTSHLSLLCRLQHSRNIRGDCRGYLRHHHNHHGHIHSLQNNGSQHIS